MDWTAWIPTFVSVVLTVAIFVGRNWIKANIERSVQHNFDARIEGVRSELRKAEETFKSDLRSKEAEILALREGVLGSGPINRIPNRVVS